MLLRMLSVMLIALAMLAAPLTMRDGMAMAAETPAMHHGEAAAVPGEGSPGSGHAQHGWKAAGGHCDEQQDPQQDQTHKATGGNCCVATCVAVVASAGAVELSTWHPLTRRPTSDADRLGTLAEIATPPPRLA